MTAAWLPVLALFAALGSGLVGGVFFAFSAFVMKALARLPPGHGAAAMRSVNRVILGSPFIPVFLGTAAGSLVLGVAGFLRLGEPGGGWLLAGSLLYLLGAFLVTVARNVPLNEALDRAEPGSAPEGGLWSRYLARWTAWNHVRTVAALAAAGSFALAGAGV